jgi:hypothetical protein
MPQAGQAYNPADIPAVVRRGHREAVFPTASTWTTTEAIAYRIDNIPVRAGKLYFICTSTINIVPSVVGDVGILRARVNEAGAATLSSNLVGAYRKYQTVTAQTDVVGGLRIPYAPTSDLTTLSIAFTLARAQAGTSSLGVRLWGSAAEPWDCWLEQVGDDPGVSGTAF